MFQIYRWKGEVIEDIDQWARDRGEKWVFFKHTVKTLYGEEVDKGFMPESFFDNLMWNANETWEEVCRL